MSQIFSLFPYQLFLFGHCQHFKEFIFSPAILTTITVRGWTISSGTIRITPLGYSGYRLPDTNSSTATTTFTFQFNIGLLRSDFGLISRFWFLCNCLFGIDRSIRSRSWCVDSSMGSRSCVAGSSGSSIYPIRRMVIRSWSARSSRPCRSCRSWVRSSRDWSSSDWSSSNRTPGNRSSSYCLSCNWRTLVIIWSYGRSSWSWPWPVGSPSCWNSRYWWFFQRYVIIRGNVVTFTIVNGNISATSESFLGATAYLRSSIFTPSPVVSCKQKFRKSIFLNWRMI